VGAAPAGDVSWAVRRAAVADAPRIAGISVLSWRHAYAGIVPAPALAGLSAERRQPSWERRIGLPDPDAVFVATAPDGVIGAYAAVGAFRADAAPGVGGAELFAIYADPAHLGSGAGRAVHAAALAHLAGQGFTQVSLWVLADNELGRRFYDRHGWQLTPDTSTAALGGAELTEVRLTRNLPAAP
jgi:GNAT superfamily N-acetyltransferase